MLEQADRLRNLGVGLKVLNLGGDAVDTSTPIGSMLFTVMTALAQMELDIKREQINDSVSKLRADCLDLGGRREKFTRSRLEKACKLVDAGEPASHVARDLGMSRATLYRRLRQLPEQGSGWQCRARRDQSALLASSDRVLRLGLSTVLVAARTSAR